MNDHEDDLYRRVRAMLTAAGFEETATGGEGVHLIHHARGVMVGWMPTQVTRRRGPRRTRPAQANLPGLRHAFTLALAATLRAAGLTVETTGLARMDNFDARLGAGRAAAPRGAALRPRSAGPAVVSWRELFTQKACERATARQHGFDGQVHVEAFVMAACAVGVDEILRNGGGPCEQSLQDALREVQRERDPSGFRPKVLIETGRDESHEAGRGLHLPVVAGTGQPFRSVSDRLRLLRQQVQPHFGLLVADPKTRAAVVQVRGGHVASRPRRSTDPPRNPRSEP